MRMPEIISSLTEAGRWAPSADNTQPWHFHWDGQVLALRYDSRHKAGFPVHYQATLLTMGAVIENVVQMANAFGLPRVWKWQIPRVEPYEFFSIRLEGFLQSSSLIANLPLFQRHTNRLPFTKEPLPGTFLNLLSGLSDSSISVRVFEGTARLKEVAELIRDASEARFQTREIHEWFARSLRFDRAEVEMGDGLDVSTFGLPLGGRALLRFISDWKRMSWLNRINGYKLLAAIEASSMTKAGAVIAVIGKPGMEAALEAGMMMERVWIKANAAGLGVQPYYIVPDQIVRLAEGSVPDELALKVAKLQTDTRNVLGLNEETLYMLFRVGHPICVPVRSKRLPLEMVFSVNQKD